jgi:hypothetical protein
MKYSNRLSRPAVVALSAISLSLTAGCVAPPTRDAGGQYQQSPPPANAGINPTGRWCFKDSRGKNDMNYIELVKGGTVASPISRKGGEAFYKEVGPNLFQNSNGATSEFYNDNQGVWRRGNRVWPHRRCG